MSATTLAPGQTAAFVILDRRGVVHSGTAPYCAVVHQAVIRFLPRVPTTATAIRVHKLPGCSDCFDMHHPWPPLETGATR